MDQRAAGPWLFNLPLPSLRKDGAGSLFMPLKPGVAQSAIVIVIVALVCSGSAVARPWHGANERPKAEAGHSGGKDQGRRSQATDAASQETADPSQYAGAETCKTCHEEQASSYDRGPHSKTPLTRHQGPGWQGCEACHGPGQEHAESGDPSKIIRFAALSPGESSGRCLKCHEFARDPLWQEHAENKVGCLGCHSMHAPRIQSNLLKVARPQLCGSCHKETSPEFSRPFHQKRERPLTGSDSPSTRLP
jgi:predicted CXXCH cytochrome family protein